VAQQFQPPVICDWPRFLPETRGVEYLFARHLSPGCRGRSVLRIAGVYTTVDVPSETQIATATEVYIGGHIYPVTDAVATALTAAGYGAYIS
jgi:hypothetical protein